MLIVKVEVWPGGNPDRAFEISRVGLTNVSGLASVSDYELTALVARNEGEAVVKGRILGHIRDHGWVPLVRRSMTNIYLSESPTYPGAYDDPIAELLRKGHCV